MASSNPSVGLIINCYEKTYRRVLTPEYINKIRSQNLFSFNNTFIVINNVKHPEDAENRLMQLKDTQIIDDYFWVHDYLDIALEQVNLTRQDFGSILPYSDWALVCLHVTKSKYLLHWDADINLVSPINWINPSLRILETSEQVITACPCWTDNIDQLQSESCYETNQFYIGFGLSDQIFLVRRDTLLAPIYQYRHLYSLRFPLAHVSSTFEKRVDSFMRKTRKYRAVHKDTLYTHDYQQGAHPSGNLFQKLKFQINMMIWYLFSKIYRPCKEFPIEEFSQ